MNSAEDYREPFGGDIERLDVSQLGRLVRERRGGQSLRAAAADAGVSFSTMSRVEGGAQPDLASFTRLCAWLGMPPSRFFSPITARPEEPLEQAIAHLNADPRLTTDAAAAISNVLKEMYANLAKTNPRAKPVIACHLRAASVMRPGVPHRLAALMDDMHTALVERVTREEAR